MHFKTKMPTLLTRVSFDLLLPQKEEHLVKVPIRCRDAGVGLQFAHATVELAVIASG